MPEGQYSTNFSSYISPSYKTAETVFENINLAVLALADAGQILFADRSAFTVISHFSTSSGRSQSP